LEDLEGAERIPVRWNVGYVLRMGGSGTGWGSFPLASFGIIGVEPLGSATTLLVFVSKAIDQCG
jgi:hypothetical protein